MSTAASASPHRQYRRGRLSARAVLVATAIIGSLGLVEWQGAAPAWAGYPTLQSTGSSFAGVAIQQWVGQASTLYGLNINWVVQSSVIGLNEFAQGSVDFGASDIPYSSGQAQSTPTFPYEYMPDVAGALAFMYNLTGNDGNQITSVVLNPAAIDDIFSGRITKWNDPAIAQLNPQLAGDLPSTTIVPVFREDASGENYLLSDYLLHTDSSTFTAYQQAMAAESGVGNPGAQWPTPPSGAPVPPGYPGWTNGNLIGQSGSDNAANYVSASSSNGAITYVETAYAKEHNEPVASVVNASGNAVQPTSVNDATALEDAILHPDLTQDLSHVYTNTLANAYPISAYSYFVAPCSPSLATSQGVSCAANQSGTSSYPSDKGNELGIFVSFIACAGQEKMALLGYSPLPPNLVQDDFDAVGRLNGGVQPPAPTPSNCKNPYVDGETPLPGEPVVQGQSGGGPGGQGVAGVSASSGPANSGTGSSTGGTTPGSRTTAGPNGVIYASGPVGGTFVGAGGVQYVIGPGGVARPVGAATAGPNAFQRESALDGAVAVLLDHLSWSGPALVWIVAFLVFLAGPPLYFVRKRRRLAASGQAGA